MPRRLKNGVTRMVAKGEHVNDEKLMTREGVLIDILKTDHTCWMRTAYLRSKHGVCNE